LANNVVPAVVLFSICVGIALIGVERKQGLLDVLDVVCQALTRVSSFVVRLTPYGIFAIAAAAAGTMTLDELGRIYAYLIVYSAVGLVLALWVVPLLVTSVTPFSYRQVVGASRDAVVTAFATGKLFVVLPLLIESTHRLFEQLGHDQPEEGDAASVLVPLAYPFPSIGKLLALLFIPFGAWYVGSPLATHQYPALFGTGLLSLFGSPLAAIPFLLDLFRLPADLFHLFLVSGVWATRISDAVGAVHLFAFSVLVSGAMAGIVRIRWRRLVGFVLSAGIVAVIVVGGVRIHLDTLSDQLREDHFDVAMAGVVATFDLLETMVIGFSGIEVTGALVVRDHLRDEVGSVDAIRALDHARFGVVGYPRISSRFHERLPNAELVGFADPREFFEGDTDNVMALVTIAEAGAAWTIRYPGFHVVVPDGVDAKGQLAYPIGGGDHEFRSYIERWATLVRDDGTVDELYDHWILGGGAMPRGHRWSVIRDVLHWVE
jgi:hypothetical protein